MKKNIIFSPEFPVGGIASWTNNIKEYLKEKETTNVIHVDASIRFKNATNKSFLFRVLSGALDTIILLYKFVFILICEKPKVIHITSSASLALFKDYLYLKFSSLFSVKCVFHYHFGRIPELSTKNNWEWKLIYYLIKHSYKSIVIDSPSYYTLCNYGLGEKIHLIPNPCSDELIIYSSKSKQEKRSEKFIFVGHVVKNKGIFELVTAFSKFELPIKLELIGPYENEIKCKIEEIAKMKNSGDWLSFSGNKDKAYVYNSMLTSQCLILPSYTEGFPTVILEAMACGCPVIATNVAAIPDMLDAYDSDKCSGICIYPKSDEEIIKALSFFIESDFKKKWGDNGRSKVLNNYTMSIVFEKYKEVWGT